MDSIRVKVATCVKCRQSLAGSFHGIFPKIGIVAAVKCGHAYHKRCYDEHIELVSFNNTAPCAYRPCGQKLNRNSFVIVNTDLESHIVYTAAAKKEIENVFHQLNQELAELKSKNAELDRRAEAQREHIHDVHIALRDLRLKFPRLTGAIDEILAMIDDASSTISIDSEQVWTTLQAYVDTAKSDKINQMIHELEHPARDSDVIDIVNDAAMQEDADFPVPSEPYASFLPPFSSTPIEAENTENRLVPWKPIDTDNNDVTPVRDEPVEIQTNTYRNNSPVRSDAEEPLDLMTSPNIEFNSDSNDSQVWKRHVAQQTYQQPRITINSISKVTRSTAKVTPFVPKPSSANNIPRNESSNADHHRFGQSGGNSPRAGPSGVQFPSRDTADGRIERTYRLRPISPPINRSERCKQRLEQLANRRLQNSTNFKVPTSRNPRREHATRFDTRVMFNNNIVTLPVTVANFQSIVKNSGFNLVETIPPYIHHPELVMQRFHYYLAEARVQLKRRADEYLYYLQQYWLIGDGVVFTMILDCIGNKADRKMALYESSFAGEIISAELLGKNIEKHIITVPSFILLSIGEHEIQNVPENLMWVGIKQLIEFLLQRNALRIVIIPPILYGVHPLKRRSLRKWLREEATKLAAPGVVMYLEFIEDSLDRTGPMYDITSDIPRLMNQIILEIITRILPIVSHTK